MEAWDPHTEVSLVANGLGLSILAYEYRHLKTAGVNGAS
jgi:hypothetical protein